MNNNKLLKNIVLLAVMSALSFALCFVQIPLGVMGKIHLGNFACILAALLFGPIIGGLSGSIGMGLSDLVSGYEFDSILRTLILKFLIGAIAGLIYKKYKNKDIKSLILIPLLLFLTIGITSLVLVIIGKGEYVFYIGNSKTTVNLLIPIFALILFLIMLILFIVSLKKTVEESIVLVATSYAIIFNIIVEFFLRFLLKLMYVDANTSLALAITKIPSSILTGVVTIIFIPIVFIPLKKALLKTGTIAQ